MRIKKGFTLRRLCGQDTVMAQGTAAANFGLMLQLSEAAAWLWRALCEEYDITPAAALSDVAALTAQWQQVGVVDATSSSPRQ